MVDKYYTILEIRTLKTNVPTDHLMVTSNGGRSLNKWLRVPGNVGWLMLWTPMARSLRVVCLLAILSVYHIFKNKSCFRRFGIISTRIVQRCIKEEQVCFSHGKQSHHDPQEVMGCLVVMFNINGGPVHAAGAAVHHLVPKTKQEPGTVFLGSCGSLFYRCCSCSGCWQPPETMATLKATNTSITACQSSLEPGHVMHFGNAGKAN